MAKVAFSDKVHETVKEIKVADLIKSMCDAVSNTTEFTEKDTLLSAAIIKLEGYYLSHGEI